MKPIKSLDELKKLAEPRGDVDDHFVDGDGCECFILLNGCARSSKTIWYFPEGQPASDWDDSDVLSVDGHIGEWSVIGVMVKWIVYHDISDSYEEFVDDEALLEWTHIATALENNALFEYAWEDAA